MGIIYSLLGWTDGEPDPILGLTPKQKKVIQASWCKAKNVQAELGPGIMILLFEKYPEYKNLFPFKDVPDDQLINNIKFKAHCSTVLYSLGQIIDNLDNTELVLALLDKLASNHKKHHIPHDGFMNIQGIIEENLRPIANDEEMALWSKLLTVAMTYTTTKMAELDAK